LVILLGIVVTQSYAQEYLDIIDKSVQVQSNESIYQTSGEEDYEDYEAGSGSGSDIYDLAMNSSGEGSGLEIESSGSVLDIESSGSIFELESNETNLEREFSGSDMEESSGSEVEMEASGSGLEVESESDLQIGSSGSGLEIESYDAELDADALGSGSGIQGSGSGLEIASSGSGVEIESSAWGMESDFDSQIGSSGSGLEIEFYEVELEVDSSGLGLGNQPSGSSLKIGSSETSEEISSSGSEIDSSGMELEPSSSTTDKGLEDLALESETSGDQFGSTESSGEVEVVQYDMTSGDFDSSGDMKNMMVKNESDQAFILSSSEEQTSNATLLLSISDSEEIMTVANDTEEITDLFSANNETVHSSGETSVEDILDSSESPLIQEGQDESRGCESSRFGCCSDDLNPAHGPNELGCCSTTEFGCCADNLTPAKGPYEEGCDCQETEFGCCPDQRTPATGTDNQGEFGCCPEEITPKQAENEECGCEASRYGCCLDGETAASGFDFQGCSMKPGEHCHLAPEQGPCSNYTSKWFYDMEWGGCNRFWYGGCDPGRNHFDDEASCKEACFEPRGAGACFLKKERKTCTQFAYSGCLGNNNRFLTKQDCVDMCMPQEDVPVCGKPKAEGACAGDFPRFFYNEDTGNCESFSFSGCLGNNNRFLTMDECESSCLHKAKQKLTDTVCKMYIEAGNCDEESEKANATLPRWGYDERMRRCVPFFYAGCGGNENNFESRQACERVCPTTFPPIITLPRGAEILVKRNTQGLNLPVAVRANPPPKVMWIRNGKEISPFDYRYDILSDFSLTIKQIGELDAGLYTITADNGIGSAATQVVEVVVYPLYPKVAIKMDKSIFKPETQVTIPCTIRGYPPPEIQWFKLGRSRNDPLVPLQEDRPRLTIETFQTTTTTTLSNVIIENASDTDSGNYRCLATTQSYPDVSDTETIQIQYGPGELCIDRPSYKHCAQIVRYKFCGNRYYGQYCCRSCTEAGYVPGGLQVR
ncbi:hypothetical protein TCAL_00430, partial [Tigriopus californicus]